MTKKDPVPKLSEDEMEMYRSSEEGEWVSVGPIEDRRAHWQAAARRTLEARRQQISVSVSEYDLMRLKAKAEARGVPYETLVGTLIHDYVEG